jgi:hypothetical protein
MIPNSTLDSISEISNHTIESNTNGLIIILSIFILLGLYLYYMAHKNL